MEIKKIQSAFHFDDVICEQLTDTKVPRKIDGYIKRMSRGDYYFYSENSIAIRFEIRDGDYKKQIEDLNTRNYDNVACVHSAEKKLFIIDLKFFPPVPRDLVQFGKFEIYIQENVRQSLISHSILNSERDNLNLLIPHFTFKDRNQISFVYSNGKYLEETVEQKIQSEKIEINEGVKKEETIETIENSDKQIQDDKKKKQLDNNLQAEEHEKKDDDEEFVEVKIQGNIRLYGDVCDLLIRLEKIGNEERVTAYKAILKKSHNNKGLLIKATGELSFSDTKSYITSRVKKRLEETPNYLNTWEEYARKEGEFLLDKARRIGIIECEPNYNNEKGRYTFSIKNLSDEKMADLGVLSPNDILEYTTENPVYLNQEEFTWEDYQDYKNNEKKENASQDNASEKNSSKKVLFKVIEIPKNKTAPFLILRLENGEFKEKQNVPHQFIFSIYGDECQIERREEARRRIVNGISSMPNLGLILSAEQDAADFSNLDSNRPHINALSALVREKVFENPPTPKQEEAIDIALNTPDIAIIQGPPGTGKTTVITAILERMNEIRNKKNMEKGQVLITSLQHDAVDNVIERLKINSLPTIKIGKKSSESDKDEVDKVTKKWCEELAEKLEKNHEFLNQTSEQLELIHSFEEYILSPDNNHAIAFLNEAKSFAKGDLSIRINDILSEIVPKENLGENTQSLLLDIYRLPTTLEGWSDDGNKKAQTLLYKLKEMFGEHFGESENSSLEWEKKSVHLLQKVALEKIENIDIESLTILRKELLNRFIPIPKSMQINEPRQDIIEINGALQQYIRRPDDARRVAIYQFYEELKEGSVRVRNALASYMFAFASTAQQSEGKEMKRLKGIKNVKEITEHAVYDTVVVDEAARVPPGDLMIPLSQANRRIIMVGDQNQLPHIYNEEIFEKLREEGKMVSEADVQSSLFEHLWNSAKSLSEQDHIPRTVTLDKQYRTHPLLGQFISDNFYEGKVESPLPAEYFKQPITPHACVWVSLPNRKNAECKKTYTGSRIRRVEAEYIVKKIIEYLGREDCKKLTFGAITFYCGQRDLIKTLLRENNIDPDENPRVRVGTVDAFQGMEFDIIFLSTVRSQRDENFIKEDLEKIINASDECREQVIKQISTKYYGFLNDNRLCVALSRQKKLLIVVGDDGMFSGRIAAPFAKRCVKSMYNLYTLCESEGSVVDG